MSSSADPQMAASRSGSAASKGAPVHLVVMCHGLWGEPRHILALETILSESLGDRARVVGAEASSSDRDGDDDSSSDASAAHERVEAATPRITTQEKEFLAPFITPRQTEANMDVVILNTTTNAGGMTYDGIDWWGDRVVKEIKAEQKRIRERRRQHIARLSMIGYSMGGLVARYVIGVLESEGFFAGGDVQARQLVTVATPHLGAPPGSGSFTKIAAFVGSRLLSRTGEQVFIKDAGWEGDVDMIKGSAADESHKVGLIEFMAQPGSVFMRGLRRFERVRFYANAVNDPTVPFRTGGVEEIDPFVEGLQVDVKLHPDAPLISSLTTHPPLPLSFGQSVYAAVPALPPFFNPRRLPFRFPYNYMVVFLAPVMLPLFFSLAIWRLSRDDRKSRLRIKDLEKGLDPDLRGSTRISALVNSVIQSAGEERVDEDPLEPEGSVRGAARARAGSAGEDLIRGSHVHVTVDSKDESSAAPRSVWTADKDLLKTIKLKQPPLLPAQSNMARHLNDPKTLPQLKKYWAYFPDVVNGHAMIVCRIPTMEVQRRGLPILKHIVDDFLL